MNVKVIRATQPSCGRNGERACEGKKLRVAAYCRVSTDSDEQETSYEAQVTHYTNYISANPEWELAGVFADEGISGTQAKTRPGFGRMIEACERREIDMILTKSISRFARNTLDCLNYIRRLKELGISIIFEKESINTRETSGELLVTILASIAQQESASIAQNVHMGIVFGFQEGHGRVNFSRFLGYNRGEKTGTYVIDPAGADMVRRIYREYLEGYSPYLIAEGLNADGVSTPSGKGRWYAATIQNIIENEKYCGDLLMQKYYTEDFLTHRTVRNKGQLPQYFVENHHEPIVPRAIYNQVQGERKRRASLMMDPGRLRHGKRDALENRLICGRCGRTLKRYVKPDETLNDWRCRDRAMDKRTNAKEQPGEKCSCRKVGEKDAHEAILKAFNTLPERREEIREMHERLNREELEKMDARLVPILEELEIQEKALAERRAQASGNDQNGEEAQKDDEKTAETVQRLRLERDRLYEERAERARQGMQLRLLLELLDQMQPEGARPGRDTDFRADPIIAAACYDAEDFFRRTSYRVPEGVLDAQGRMVVFRDELVIRYLESVTVQDGGYDMHFKTGIRVWIPVE